MRHQAGSLRWPRLGTGARKGHRSRPEAGRGAPGCYIAERLSLGVGELPAKLIRNPRSMARWRAPSRRRSSAEFRPGRSAPVFGLREQEYRPSRCCRRLWGGSE
jgi:hypothetical protein